MAVRALRALACSTLIVGCAACTPPIWQFDIKNQALTCEQANEHAFRTLQAMGFTMTGFDRAAVGRPGRLHGTREDRGTQNVTVSITCDGRTADIDASEDGKLLGQLEFKRGFYLSFTATEAQANIIAAAKREEAQRPLLQKKEPGLRVLIEPVRGLGAKLDFDLDLAAAGVLPVQVTITNATTRTYRFDPTDVALIQKDGTRVRPLAVDAAVQRVSGAANQPAAADSAPPDSIEVTRRLQAHVLSGPTVSSNQTLKGYVFFPLGEYVKGRIALEDQESEESEGFVVEF